MDVLTVKLTNSYYLHKGNGRSVDSPNGATANVITVGACVTIRKQNAQTSSARGGRSGVSAGPPRDNLWSDSKDYSSY